MPAIRFGAPTAIANFMTTELNGLGSNARALGNTVFDNDIERYVHCSIGLAVTFTVAPTDGSIVSLYLLPSIDGTNYVDGSATVAPSGESLVGNYILKNSTALQRMTLSDIRLTPVKYRPLLVNASNQPFPASDTLLRIVKYSYESV